VESGARLRDNVRDLVRGRLPFFCSSGEPKALWPMPWPDMLLASMFLRRRDRVGDP
jgi:hypothetical protein